MEDPKAAAVARLKDASNVLVTVSTNPSVDQLAGAIGMTLLLNKLGKHATAVFSGDIPSTIEFLQPEQTLEKNTDSLRDFIISLDKAKADKLRYKVEEKLVRIFITPYHTSLSHDDLEFSLGDFNVDVIIALGVHEQQDLDQAIAAHGRILHDATIIAINTQPNGNLGTISWIDEKASSLSEMLADIGVALKSDVLDEQMATALLTGIVAETERFSNEKTSSATMSLSAKLMAAGANQQLVATKLQESSDNMLPAAQPDSPSVLSDEDGHEDGNNPDGSLRIDHEETEVNGSDQEAEASPLPPEKPNDDNKSEDEKPPEPTVPATPKIMTEPPSMGGTLTASSRLEEQVADSVNPLSLPPVNTPLLRHNSDKKKGKHPSKKLAPKENPPEPLKPEAPTVNKTAQEDSKTLEEIEEAVESPHINQKVEEPTEPNLEEARAALESISGNGDEESAAAGAQPVNLDLGHGQEPSATVTPTVVPEQDHNEQYLDVTKLDETTGLPINHVAPSNELSPKPDAGNNQTSLPPPLVPPPLMPPPSPMRFGEQPLDNHEDDNQPQEPLAPL